MPLTSRTMAIEYSSRSDASSAGCVLASGGNWPPAHESLYHMRRVVFKGDSHRRTLVMQDGHARRHRLWPSTPSDAPHLDLDEAGVDVRAQGHPPSAPPCRNLHAKGGASAAARIPCDARRRMLARKYCGVHVPCLGPSARLQDPQHRARPPPAAIPASWPKAPAVLPTTWLATPANHRTGHATSTAHSQFPVW